MWAHGACIDVAGTYVLYGPINRNPFMWIYVVVVFVVRLHT